MAKQTILVVEDEEDILELVRYNLAGEGYGVLAVQTGEAGLSAAKREHPDLIVLDLMLPGIDGLDVCRELKANASTRSIPIIILTAKGEEADIVAGLALGADDYITKPFSPRILMARIKTVLRRKAKEPVNEMADIMIHNIMIRPRRHEATVDDRPIPLTSTEFKLLHLLAGCPGWVFTRYQIVDGVHGGNYPVTDRSVDVQIVGLRKKLGSAGRFIKTVRGVGYKLEG